MERYKLYAVTCYIALLLLGGVAGASLGVFPGFLISFGASMILIGHLNTKEPLEKDWRIILKIGGVIFLITAILIPFFEKIL